MYFQNIALLLEEVQTKSQIYKRLTLTIYCKYIIITYGISAICRPGKTKIGKGEIYKCYVKQQTQNKTLLVVHGTSLTLLIFHSVG